MTDQVAANDQLPSRFTRCFLAAIEKQIGLYSLHAMMLQAGLPCQAKLSDQYGGQSGTGVRGNIDTILGLKEISTTQSSSLQECFRNYYGKGAPRTLLRIGRLTFHELVHTAPLPAKLQFLFRGLLPPIERRRRTMQFLAGQFQLPNNPSAARWLDSELIFIDSSGYTTCEQKSDESICWTTLGLILEALEWSTGESAEAEEIACRAMGADACRFKVHQA